MVESKTIERIPNRSLTASPHHPRWIDSPGMERPASRRTLLRFPARPVRELHCAMPEAVDVGLAVVLVFLTWFFVAFVHA